MSKQKRKQKQTPDVIELRRRNISEIKRSALVWGLVNLSVSLISIIVAILIRYL